LHFSRNFQSTLSYNTWFGHSSVMLFSIHKFMLIKLQKYLDIRVYRQKLNESLCKIWLWISISTYTWNSISYFF
jgi:hypothetical protein